MPKSSGLTSVLPVLSLLFSIIPLTSSAQGLNATGSGAAVNALKIFLDCKDFSPCYHDYVKMEITYVDHVNVREAADVHVLVTSLGTGAGGREYTLKFVGLGDFKGTDDEVVYATQPTDTEELIRRGLVRTLQLGLVRYALHTTLGSELHVARRSAQGTPQQTGESRSARDPWNYWVFRTRFNTYTEDEALSTSKSVNGSFSANRTTDAWKINLSVSQDYRESNYTFSDGSGYKSLVRSRNMAGTAVKSLTDHWSAGGKASALASTYENKDRALSTMAAIEYNFFPYRESTRRQLTLQYLVGVTNFDYDEETVYGKVTETVSNHALRSSFDLKQTWGSLSADFEASQYLHDWSKSHRTVSVEADIRLFKGFAFNINVRNSAIHDQLYLPKGEATDEEVLARQRQLQTSFRRSIRFGISYTFGSVYSNAVNTRIGNLVGGPDWFFF